jgi:hypothetical protein
MASQSHTWYNKCAPAMYQHPGARPNLDWRFSAMSVPHTFYVYVLARPNGQPFYVGKGQGRRVFRHDQEARSGCTCHKCNIIRKIWRNGGDVQRVIIFTTDSENEAYAYETEMIALYGRDSLCNHTDGGGGPSGRSPSQETRQKISQKLMGHPGAKSKKMRLEDKERIGALNRGRTLSPETRAKMSQGMKGRAIPESTRQAVREASSRSYPGFIAPDGTIYRDVWNLRAFCREYGLLHSHMYAVHAGTRKTHRGWRRVQDV